MYVRKIALCIALLGIGIACEDILEEPDISNSEVQILAPTDQSTISGNEVNFNWGGVEDATSYKIQVARPNFENAAQIVLDSSMVMDTTGFIGTKIEKLLFLNGNYQWRIKALNGGFETPFTTAGFSVDGDENIDLIAPNTPELVSPSDGSSLNDTSIDFVWTRTDISGSAERDSIYIFKDENLQSLETKALGANKTYTATLSANTYYWIVKAFDAAGNESEASAVFEFIIN